MSCSCCGSANNCWKKGCGCPFDSNVTYGITTGISMQNAELDQTVIDQIDAYWSLYKNTPTDPCCPETCVKCSGLVNSKVWAAFMRIQTYLLIEVNDTENPQAQLNVELLDYMLGRYIAAKDKFKLYGTNCCKKGSCEKPCGCSDKCCAPCQSYQSRNLSAQTTLTQNAPLTKKLAFQNYYYDIEPQCVAEVFLSYFGRIGEYPDVLAINANRPQGYAHFLGLQLCIIPPFKLVRYENP